MTFEEINKTIHDWRAGRNRMITQDSPILKYCSDIGLIRFAILDLSEEERGLFLDRLKNAVGYPVEEFERGLSNVGVTLDFMDYIEKWNNQKLFFSNALVQSICLLRIIKPDFRESSKSQIEVRNIIAQAVGWKDIVGDYGIRCNRLGLGSIKNRELKMEFHERIPDYHKLGYIINGAQSDLNHQRLLQKYWFYIKVFVLQKYFNSQTRYFLDECGDALLTCDLLIEALECEQKILGYLKKQSPTVCSLGDKCISQKTLGVLCRCDLERYWPFTLDSIVDILEKIEKTK